MMSAPATNLHPPLDTPITLTELAKYNGVPEGQKIYIGIKGGSLASLPSLPSLARHPRR